MMLALERKSSQEATESPFHKRLRGIAVGFRARATAIVQKIVKHFQNTHRNMSRNMSRRALAHGFCEGNCISPREPFFLRIVAIEL